MNRGSRQRALIIGAGRTGRGLCGLLCQRSGWDYVLVDCDQTTVSRLRADPGKALVLGTEEHIAFTPAAILAVDDARLEEECCLCDVCFTAVGGNALPRLAKQLAVLMAARQAHGCGILHVITCENHSSAAATLRRHCEQAAPDLRGYLDRCLRISEGIVLKSCMLADNQHDVLAQEYHELPCDGEAFDGPAPALSDLKPLPNFTLQLRRKIFTYNAINAVISYLGAAAGYKMLADAANDPDINKQACAAASVCNAALIAHYDFDPAEQQQWSDAALAKFRDRDIPDPLQRNCAQARRKLGVEDRLLAPALLALEHDIDPAPLLCGIYAALHYVEDGGSLLALADGDVAACMHDVAGLPAEHPLVQRLLQLHQEYSHV